MTSLLLLSLLAAAPSAPTDVYSLSNDAFVETARHDLGTLQQFVGAMGGVMTSVGKNKPLFTLKESSVYSPEQKQTLLSTWGMLWIKFSFQYCHLKNQIEEVIKRIGY